MRGLGVKVINNPSACLKKIDFFDKLISIPHIYDIKQVIA